MRAAAFLGFLARFAAEKTQNLRVLVPAEGLLQRERRAEAAEPPALLEGYRGFQYAGEVSVGTPPQKLRVIFDTGSSSVWLRPRSIARTGLDFVRSASFALTVETKLGWFHSGHLRGAICADNFALAGLELGRLPFNLILGDAGLIDPFDGIVGLNDTPRCAFLAALRRPRLLARNVFSFGFAGGDGWVEFAPALPASARFFPRALGEFWSVRVEELRVGDAVVAGCADGCNAVVDSATPILVASPAVAEELIALMGLRADCSNLHELGELRLRVGDSWLSLPAADFALSLPRLVGCAAAVSASPALPPRTLVLGAVFLRTVGTFFDFDRGSLGFDSAF